jgi:predicted kinase
MTGAALIIVSGPPASGKSTVARRLADRFGIALVAKDTLKEGLFDAESPAIGGDRADLSRRAGGLALQEAARYLQRGESVLLEGNWRAAEYAVAVAALVREYRPRVMQILCVAAGETLLERFVTRALAGERHVVHADLEVLPRLRAELARGRYDPLPLDGPVLEIDTTLPVAAGADACMAAVEVLLQR